MINYVNEQLFKNDSVHKSWSITGNGIDLKNTDLYGECVELSESACKEANIIFGSCVSDTIKFTTFDTATSFKGKEILVTVVLNHDTENPFEVGHYIIDEETLSNDRAKKEIFAYDKNYKVINENIISWYNGLTFPLTKKQFRDSLFNYLYSNFGIQQVSTTLINDNMTIRKTIDTNELSGLKVLNAICEASGVLGHMSRNGVFKYIQLGTTSVYNIAKSMYKKLEHEDYVVQPINKLQIRQEDGDIGVIIGNGNNGYVIEDNFLFYGMSTEELTPVAQNIYDVISLVTYTPCHIEIINGNPCLEIGDKVTVTKKDNTTFTTYILNRTINGLQKLSETIDVKGDEFYPKDVNGIAYDIRQLEGKSNVLKRSIEQTQLQIVNVAEGLSSTITQTAEELSIQIQHLQSEIDGEIEYFERNGAPTLNNYPYYDFCTNVPFDGSVVFGENGIQFIVTEQNRQDHLRDLVFDKQNAVSYRFNYETIEGTKNWFWQVIAESETTYILSQLAELRVTAEELESNYTTISSTVTAQGRIITTHSSSIQQNSDRITAEVTRATNREDSLQTSLSLYDDRIEAKVSKTGGSPSSFGWELTNSKWEIKGNNKTVFAVTKNRAKVVGTIEADDGKIAGWNIASTAIYKDYDNNQVRLQSDGTIGCFDTRYASDDPRYILYALQCDGHAVLNNATINGYTTTSDFNAVKARVGSLEADHVTVNQLNAVNAKFNNLNASNITAGTLSVNRLDINGLIASFRGKAVVCSSMSSDYGYFTNLYKVENNVGQFGFTRRQTTIAGTTIYYWGW